MATTKAEIEEITQELEVLCRIAEERVQSFMPIGFGEPWQAEHDRMVRELRAIPDRFTELVRLARKQHGWAAK